MSRDMRFLTVQTSVKQVYSFLVFVRWNHMDLYNIARRECHLKKDMVEGIQWISAASVVDATLQ